MGDRQPQVGDARLEVVLEAGERARQLVDVVGADAGRQLARDRPRRRPIAGRNARLEFRPQVGRNLGCEVAHPMRQAALARRTGEAFLDRPHDRQAIASAPLFDVWSVLASGQALGAVNSYPAGGTDPGAQCAACKQRRDGIQLRVSGFPPTAARSHIPSRRHGDRRPEATSSSPHQTTIGRNLAPVGTRPWVA